MGLAGRVAQGGLGVGRLRAVPEVGRRRVVLGGVPAGCLRGGLVGCLQEGLAGCLREGLAGCLREGLAGCLQTGCLQEGCQRGFRWNQHGRGL